jgi:hypothetical protein
MNPCLKGTPVPPAGSVIYPLSPEIKKLRGFHDLQTYYPGLGIFCNIQKPPSEDIWFNHAHRVIGTKESEDSVSKSSGWIDLRVEQNKLTSGVDIQDISGFRKITHLLDPTSWIQGKYSLPKNTKLPWHQSSWGAAWTKLQDPMNQAYVEALATYAFSILRERDLSPHFHHFYGAFCAIADTYAYNITDSYMSYRHCRWFWREQEKGIFSIGFDDDDVPEEVKASIMEQPTELHDTDDDDDDKKENKENGDVEELKGLDAKVDNASLHSASNSDIETASDDDDDDDDDDDEDELDIFAEIKNFPVMMIYTEASEDTMDELLDDYDAVGSKPGSKDWDTVWSAWIFQIIAALTVGQSIFGFTHNDLHSNNIVWTKTEITHLYYSTRDGIIFKVPTFGKIFRLIDFGRSIFRINEHCFFSDDFRPGNDAAEQYNFGEFQDNNEPFVPPNPSFDLARFTVSVFESLFPSSPPRRKNGAVLSNEPGLKVIETESDLYNLLWSWLVCDDGHNILMEPDGKERYPDFELYKIIAAKLHNAIPFEQVRKPVFEKFRVSSAEGAKVYSLFC